jgi:hypothetical protein
VQVQRFRPRFKKVFAPLFSKSGCFLSLTSLAVHKGAWISKYLRLTASPSLAAALPG